MKIQYQACEYTLPEGISLAEALKTMDTEHLGEVMACFDGGTVVELSDPLTKDCELDPITFQNEEGRRIYERTLRCVMLLALQHLYPGVKVRIEHSIGYGIFLRLEDRSLSMEELENIDQEMHRIVQADYPITKQEWKRERAIMYFHDQHWDEKCALLLKQTDETITIYTCDTLSESYYGALLPSRGYVHCFSLRLVYPGITMMMPSPQDPRVPAPYIHRPKNFSAFSQSVHSLENMRVHNACDLNRMIEQGSFRKMIRVNEALHDKSISQIADRAVGSRAKAIFIAGPSSSGKTTFSNRLSIHLQVLGFEPVLISLDDFYKNKNEILPDENGEIDLEDIHALDIPYLTTTISQLLNGKTAMLPKYDFQTGKRLQAYTPLKLNKQQIILFEGIHALNPILHEGFDPSLIFTIYISELTCINLDNHNRIRTTDARLLRRLVRDYQFRNASASETLEMWPSVRRGEEKWIFPFQEHVDCVFNSVLHYELPVLKPMAVKLLKEIKPENRQYLVAKRLLNILSCFMEVPSEICNEIPPLSILREFIGGCTLY